MTTTNPPFQTEGDSFYDEAYYYAGDKAYRNYDAQNPAYKINYYTRVMQNAMVGVEKPRVLDIGCAIGLVLEHLPNNWHKSGIDASTYAIEQARKKLPDADLSTRMLPDPTKRYDIITAFDVIEHIIDFSAMLRAMRDGLTVQGKCVVVLPVFDGIFGAIYQKLDYDPTHHNKWSRDQWLSVLSVYFEIESWTGIFRYLTPLGYAHVPTRLFRGCAPAIIVTMKRKVVACWSEPSLHS